SRARAAGIFTEMGPDAIRRIFLRTCAVTTQRMLDERVTALMTSADLPSMDSLVTDVRDPRYSHVELMAWTYAMQLRPIQEILHRESTRPVVVVELGVGVGGFSLAAARFLGGRGWGDRVRFVAI